MVAKHKTDFERYGRSGRGKDYSLFRPRGTAAEAEDEVEGALLLDVVVREGAAVLQLLAGEDKPLLVRGDPLLVLQTRLRKNSPPTT